MPTPAILISPANFLAADGSRRHAVVTGASSGIGLAFAQRLAGDGYELTLVGRDLGALNQIALTLPRPPHCVMALDLTQAPDLDCLSQCISARRTHLLINNAGIGHYGAYHLAPSSSQDELLALNCIAVQRLSRRFLEQAQAGDALVNVSSIMAFLPQPTSALYAASKAFVTSLTESLWYENRARDVYVMALHPGMTRTQFRVRAGGAAEYGKSAHAPEDVADIGMYHLQHRSRPTVVCGRMNRLVCSLARLLPRQTLVAYLGRTRSYEPQARGVIKSGNVEVPPSPRAAGNTTDTSVPAP